MGPIYYFPNNAFVGLGVGFGRASIADNDTGVTLDTNLVPFAKIEAGREWWVSDNWAIGISGRLLDVSGAAASDHLNLLNFSALISATYN